MAEIRPRDVILTTSSETRREELVHHVKLFHKPSRVAIEAEGPTYENARLKADLQLQYALDLTAEEEAAFS